MAQLQVPLVHITNTAVTSFVTAKLQQLSFGAGVNYFVRNGYFFDLNLVSKYLASSKDITKTSQSYEVSAGVNKAFSSNFSLGLEYLNMVNKLNYEISNQGFANTGTADLSLSAVNLKFSWMY